MALEYAYCPNVFLAVRIFGPEMEEVLEKAVQ
jgi:hypothetical protein